MLEKPLVSIKMITYNHEPYIAQAIEGVLLQQTDFPIELVIGEDCSTDGTCEIVFNYQKKYPDIIRVITSEQNVGMHKNGYRTVKACRGKYVAYCEGDDYWHDPRKLQKQVDYLEQNPDVGLVHSDVVLNDIETKRVIPSYSKARDLAHNYEDVLRCLIEWKYIIMTCSIVARKHLLDEIYRTCQFEFSDDFPMGDIQIWIEISYRSIIRYIDEPLSTHNLLQESASQSKDFGKQGRFTNSGMKIRFHYAEKYGGEYTEDIKKEIVRRKNSFIMRHAYKGDDAELALEAYQRSRKYKIPLDNVNYLYIIGSHNKITFYLAVYIVLFFKLIRNVFRNFRTTKSKNVMRDRA